MKFRHLSLAVALAAGTVAVQAPAVAQETVVPAGLVATDSGKVRIDLSGKLRMLSQQIPSATCHFVEGIETEAAAAILTGAVADFDRILNALRFEDPGLNIVGPEENRKVLAEVDKVAALWTPFKAAAEAIAAGDASSANVERVFGANMDLLAASQLLVTEIIGEYSNPAEMVQAESMLIDISGRQRMLTEKMSKESCMLRSGFGSGVTAEALQGTMQVFETSLDALRNGMPSVGIRRPPTPAISAGLDLVHEEWTDVKPNLDALLAGAEQTAEDKSVKFRLLNEMLVNMNKVVLLYQDAVSRSF